MKKRGEIWWVNFDPSVGQEVKKKRPAVVISNDISNKYLERYQVVPLSSKTGKLYRAKPWSKLVGKRVRLWQIN